MTIPNTITKGDYMITKSKSLVAIAIATALCMTACSSSDTNPTTTDAEQGPIGTPGTNVPDNTVDNPDTVNNPDPNGDTLTPNDPGTVNNPDPTDTPTPPLPPGALDLRTINNNILTSMAGYDLEARSEEIAQLAQSIITSSTSSGSLPATTVSITDQGVARDFPVENVRYDCPQGGMLTVNILDADLSLNGYVSETNATTYLFDQCQLATAGGQTLGGQMMVGTRSEIINRDNNIEKMFEWQAFEWQKAEGQTDNITASISIKNANSQDNDDIRSVTIDQYMRTDGDADQFGLQNVTFLLRNLSLAGGGIYEYTLNIAGEVLDLSGISINVVTDPELTRRFVNPQFDEPSVPFNGQISFTASDGSSLNMVAMGSEGGNRLVDVIYTDASGNTSTSAKETFIELEVIAP